MATKAKGLFVKAPPVVTLAESAVYKFPENTNPPKFVFKKSGMEIVQGEYVMRHSVFTAIPQFKSPSNELINYDKPALVSHGNTKYLLLPDVKTIAEEFNNAVNLYAHAKKNKIDFIEGANVISDIPHTATVMAHYFAALSAGIKQIIFYNIDRQHGSKLNDFILDNWSVFSGLKTSEAVLNYLGDIITKSDNPFYVPKSDRLLEEIEKGVNDVGFKKAFAEIARRESKKITSALAAVESGAGEDIDHIGIFWVDPESTERKFVFKDPSVPDMLIDKLSGGVNDIGKLLRTEPDYQVILAAFVVYFGLKGSVENANKVKDALSSSPNNNDQTIKAIEILKQYIEILNEDDYEEKESIQEIIDRLSELARSNTSQTIEEGRVLELLAKTQTGEMDGPIKELLREIVTRFGNATLQQEGKAHLKFVNDYLAWLDGGDTGDAPNSKWSVAFKSASVLLRDEKTKRQGLIALVDHLNNLQQTLIDELLPGTDDVKTVNYSKAIKSESGVDKYVFDKAWREAESLVQKREIPDKRPETVDKPGALERMGDAIGNAAENIISTGSVVGRQLSKIPGAPAVRRGLIDPVGRLATSLAAAPVNAASAAVDAAMSTRVGKSAVCDKDEENLSDLQILLRSSIEHADRYLVTQYKMFGMWAVFNLALIGVIVYFLYRIFRAVLSYVQLVRELRKKRETTKSNDIFNPADDSDHYPVDPKLVAKSRLPSGAAIESRLRRLSEETGMDVRGAMDSAGDKYEKKKTDEDDEDDKFYRSRV